MGSQSVGARRNASAENVEADYTFNQPNGSDGLDADPRGTHLETDRGLAAAVWAATSTVGFQSTEALRRAPTGNVEASHGFHQPDGLDESDEAGSWGLRLETERGHAAWAWTATSAVDSPSWEATENAPAEDAGANYTTTGSDGPPRAWAPGAPDHGDGASVARRDKVRPAEAHAPVGMHAALDAEEAHGASHGSRHESQGYGTQWHHGAQQRFVPPPTGKTYGAPGEGALEGERSVLRGQALLTPATLGNGAQPGVVPGVRAFRASEPPALLGAYKYAARRGSSTPPQRAVGEEADARGDLPTDKGDLYVGWNGESHEPERRPDHAEAMETQAEIEDILAQVQALQDKRRRRNLEEEASELYSTMESDAKRSDTELSAIKAALAALLQRRPGAGDVGDPAANPVHHPPSGRVNRPRAAEQPAPPSAAARTAGRKTDGPLYGAATPGGGGRLHLQPEAGPRRAPSAPLGLQCQPHGAPPRDTLLGMEAPPGCDSICCTVPSSMGSAPSATAGTEGGQPKATDRDPTTGQPNGRPPACDPYADSREQPVKPQQWEELSVCHAQATCEQLITTTREGATWEGDRRAAAGARTPIRAMGRKGAGPATPRTGYAAVGASAIPCIRQGAFAHLDCPRLAPGEDPVPVAMTRFSNPDGPPADGRAAPLALVPRSERIAYLARVRVEGEDHGTYPDIMLNAAAATLLKVYITDEARRCCQSNGLWMHAVRRAKAPVVGYASVVVSYAPADGPSSQRLSGDSPPGRGKWAYARVAVIKDGQRLPAGAHLKAMPVGRTPDGGPVYELRHTGGTILACASTPAFHSREAALTRAMDLADASVRAPAGPPHVHRPTDWPAARGEERAAYPYRAVPSAPAATEGGATSQEPCAREGAGAASSGGEPPDRSWTDRRKGGDDGPGPPSRGADVPRGDPPTGAPAGGAGTTKVKADAGFPEEEEVGALVLVSPAVLHSGEDHVAVRAVVVPEGRLGELDSRAIPQLSREGSSHLGGDFARAGDVLRLNPKSVASIVDTGNSVHLARTDFLVSPAEHPDLRVAEEGQIYHLTLARRQTRSGGRAHDAVDMIPLGAVLATCTIVGRFDAAPHSGRTFTPEVGTLIQTLARQHQRSPAPPPGQSGYYAIEVTTIGTTGIITMDGAVEVGRFGVPVASHLVGGISDIIPRKLERQLAALLDRALSDNPQSAARGDLARRIIEPFVGEVGHALRRALDREQTAPWTEGAITQSRPQAAPSDASSAPSLSSLRHFALDAKAEPEPVEPAAHDDHHGGAPTTPASDGGDPPAPQPRAGHAGAGELDCGKGAVLGGPSKGAAQQARMCRLDLNQDSDQFVFEFETQSTPVAHNGKSLNAFTHLDTTGRFYELCMTWTAAESRVPVVSQFSANKGMWRAAGSLRTKEDIDTGRNASQKILKLFQGMKANYTAAAWREVRDQILILMLKGMNVHADPAEFFIIFAHKLFETASDTKRHINLNLVSSPDGFLKLLQVFDQRTTWASLLMSDGEQKLSKALAELVDMMWDTAGSSTPSALFARTCAKVQPHFAVVPVKRIASAMGVAVNDALADKDMLTRGPWPEITADLGDFIIAIPDGSTGADTGALVQRLMDKETAKFLASWKHLVLTRREIVTARKKETERRGTEKRHNGDRKPPAAPDEHATAGAAGSDVRSLVEKKTSGRMGNMLVNQLLEQRTLSQIEELTGQKGLPPPHAFNRLSWKNWERYKDEWIAKGRAQYEPLTLLNLALAYGALNLTPIDGADEGVGVFIAPDKDPGQAADWSRQSRRYNCDSGGACMKLCIAEQDLQKLPADVARKHKDLGYSDWNKVTNAGGTALRCLNNSGDLVALLYETIVGMSKADQDKHFWAIRRKVGDNAKHILAKDSRLDNAGAGGAGAGGA